MPPPRIRANPMLRVPCRLYPELRRFPAGPDRRTAWARARPAQRWNLACAAASVVVISPLFIASQQARSLAVPAAARVAISLGAIFAALAVLSAIFNAFGRPVRRRLRGQLRERGIAVCLHCGYDLAGQADERCPECGAVSSDQ